MDDLDHSVLIAEQDWDSFYEESEECSIQQAKLAGLDDSGLSDNDNENNSTQEPVLPHQSDTKRQNEECGAAAQALSAVDDCEVRKPSEDSEYFCYKSELEVISLTGSNDGTATCACLSSDSSVNDIVPDGQQNNQTQSTDMNNIKEHDQSQSEDIFSHVTEKTITNTSSSCTQDAEYADSAEGSVKKVMESLATPKKEKERWFVTVNDSPVQHSAYSGTSGQKKRRKKKSSRKLSQRSRDTRGKRPQTNNEKEAEEENIKEEKKVQNKLKPPTYCSLENLHFNTFPDHVNEDKADSTNFQQPISAPAEEPGEEACEKSSVPKTKDERQAYCLKSKRTIDVSTENNSSASEDLQPSVILTHNPQLQSNVSEANMTHLAKDQSTVMAQPNEHKSNTDIITPNQPVTNNSSKVHNDPKENSSKQIWKVSSNICSLDEQHEQQTYLTNSQEEEKMCSVQETQNQEPPKESLKEAVGPSRPIYALSSFWDEMEKLTINDILHLREANRSPHDVHLRDRDLLDSKPPGLPDSILVDDSADSDYFTHLDDCKPDRSSCEFSTLSDFDDEFLQIINTSANPSPEPHNLNQTERFLESAFMSELLTQQELELPTVNNERESEDIIMLCPQDRMPLYLYPAQQAQSGFFPPNLNSNGNSFKQEGIRNTPSPVLSVGDILDDQCLLHFSEFFAKDDIGLQKITPDRCSPVVSFYSSKKLSVPETYDDFFSDFVVGNLLFPSVHDQTVPIPIFSSSRLGVRNLVFPEVEELIESDFENNDCQIRVMTCFRDQRERPTSPTGTPNLFFFTSQRRNWRSLFSLRKNSIIRTGSTWCQKVSSWIFPKETKKVTSYVSRAQPIPYICHLEDQQNYAKHTALISEREDLLFSFKQADMCLVCIAFASWVLKSSNPQSTDMWKAALLANVSALSAIQYLRKYEKKEGTEDDP